MKIGKSEIATTAAVVLALAILAVIVFLPGSEPAAKRPAHSQEVLVCIDSTESTDDVRDKYQVDLEKVARQAAFRQDHLLAAACGANATGEVDWPVGRWFTTTYSSDRFAREELESQAETVIEGNDEKEGIVDLLEIESKETTPIGEMLAVTARQCDGDDCQIYLFTDGEWADHILRVKEGISDTEKKDYIKTYGDKLGGLEGSTVNFIGVGLGTKIGEVALEEAKLVAMELVEGGGGEMGRWKTRL
jgi:hypothetical protein